MIFDTRIPATPLGDYVASLYYYEGYTPVHSIERFLPDGNTEIVINLGSDPQYIYDNETLEELQACQKVWVSGIRTKPITIPSGRKTRMLIITFKKGKAYPFYHLPLNELTDLVIDGDLLFGKGILELHEKLQMAKHTSIMFALVEEFLLGKAKWNYIKDVQTKCIDFAMDSLMANPTNISLSALSEKIGYSQKHLIELFRQKVGLTPKKYLNILKFQLAIQSIQFERSEWTQIASQVGYYDQAHFINQFKKLSGFTPSQYLAMSSEHMNNVPVA